jgi:hypothetical protein
MEDATNIVSAFAHTQLQLESAYLWEGRQNSDFWHPFLGSFPHPIWDAPLPPKTPTAPPSLALCRSGTERRPFLSLVIFCEAITLIPSLLQRAGQAFSSIRV